MNRRLLLGALVLGLGLLPGVSPATSLYDEQRYRSLVSDVRSFQAGQSLTVLIYEQAAASASADTDTSKSTDVEASVQAKDWDRDAELGIGSDFSGGGNISRSGQLMGSVSVTIEQVLLSGELLIYGEQLIEFNDEKQQIRVSGRVRPEDVSAQNTVPSTRITDAQISYIGDGLLGSRQKPGILTRFFNWLF